MQSNNIKNTASKPFTWAIKFATWAGITGILCCVAPAVLFALGLMGGIYAISFANFFYDEDGSTGLGSWLLRGIAILIGIIGIVRYRKKQNQCSIDPKRKQKNLILVIIIIIFFGLAIFFTLEKWSSWYFDTYIVPAQQQEYKAINHKN